MYVIISLTLAVIPALLWLLYYYKQDKIKPEPKGLLTKVFLFGVLSIIPILIVEIILDTFYQIFFGQFFLIYIFLRAFIVAAVCEEFFKLIVVLGFAYRSPHFDETVDGIIYCIFASLGFAAFENILYVLDTGYTTAILRAFTALPLHAIVSGLMGYYVGQAKFAENKQLEQSLIFKGFIIAVILHGTYNFLLFAIPVFGVLPALLNIPLIIISFFALRKKIRLAIEDDIQNGRSVKIEYDIVLNSLIK